MITNHIITHGLFYAILATGYLFLMMVTTSPRVWGYSDYPQIVKDKVPPPTRQERLVALIWFVPWMVFVFGFPIYSTLVLKGRLGGEITFWVAFLHLFVMFLLMTIGDMVILDWLVISKITPQFVIIPGSEAVDYKDFSHHYIAHVKASVIIILIIFVIAAVVS